MVLSKYTPAERLVRKRMAARLRQQRCRARKRAAAAAAKDQSVPTAARTTANRAPSIASQAANPTTAKVAPQAKNEATSMAAAPSDHHDHHHHNTQHHHQHQQQHQKPTNKIVVLSRRRAVTYAPPQPRSSNSTANFPAGPHAYSQHPPSHHHRPQQLPVAGMVHPYAASARPHPSTHHHHPGAPSYPSSSAPAASSVAYEYDIPPPTFAMPLETHVTDATPPPAATAIAAPQIRRHVAYAPPPPTYRPATSQDVPIAHYPPRHQHYGTSGSPTATRHPAHFNITHHHHATTHSSQMYFPAVVSRTSSRDENSTIASVSSPESSPAKLQAPEACGTPPSQSAFADSAKKAKTALWSKEKAAIDAMLCLGKDNIKEAGDEEADEEPPVVSSSCRDRKSQTLKAESPIGIMVPVPRPNSSPSVA